MTGEERWRAAIAAEAEQPSTWTPDLAALEANLLARLQRQGCGWSGLALVLLRARGLSSLSRNEFARRLGLSEEQLQTLEGGSTPAPS